jgi:hypothetical protein
MDTETLRATTRTHAERMKGKIWPNGLGFDTGRWMISYSERAGQWFAGSLDGNFAYADTPEAALAKARTPGLYTEEED